MKTNFTLLFYLKKPKNYSNGVAPIYLRITVEGNRAELATSRECEPDQWNAKAGHLIGTKDDIKALNAYLDKMKAEVYVAHSLLCAEDAEITAETIKCRFLGKEEKTHTLCEAIKTHNKNMKALVGKDYAIGTLKRFEILERHVKGFLASKHHKSDLNIKYVNYDFISGFDHYLRTAQNNTTNTAVKHLKNLGKIIRICLSKKWITTDPFFGYKLKTKVVHREYLTADELRKIEEKEFTTTRLSQVKDVFLFSCYTGLSYADVEKLRPSDISDGVDGERWIFTYRKKTGTRAAIPLLPIVANIVDKYKDHPYCVSHDRVLPVSSNQKMNEYLVEIAALSQVNKKIGNRIAKRTFATTVTLLNGVPIESVSKMLGHTNIRTTQLYAKILDVKVGSDMALLKKKYALI